MNSEILHGGEGGDIERWLESRNKLVCDCFIAYIYLFIIYSFLSINTHLNKIAIEHLNFYLEESRGEVQSPSREIRLQVLFWVTDCIIHFKLINLHLISYTSIHPL